jgi:hypothetical protein
VQHHEVIGAGDRDDMAPGHYLTPPERCFASFILERRRTHQPSKSPRLDQNYGPEGIALMAAAILSGLIGAVVGFVGIALLLLSDDHGPLLHPGYYIIVAGIVLEVPSITRSIQANAAGRRFRGDRPFVKRS